MATKQITQGVSTKVAAGGAAGLLTGIVIYILGLCGVAVSPDLYALIVPLVTVVVGYLTPEAAIVKKDLEAVLDKIELDEVAPEAKPAQPVIPVSVTPALVEAATAAEAS